uniref:RBR-type E3 ubiquitin transferase n=1 Tax=Chromera velia CCMP2878 TaxID=1169474 RepID=A0A0G4HT99_9ALVE|eukprot:Cvel_8432.t1-p1 / transcript=Cvel_8432.t1 / gene=Cvel_8432 / organism=Chromera_velia_CCMP2878 / gene_product=E3 ubiquitin-protein ligase RNF14, putative / transcript_product=E3 ubiquitin-protein ligase RNF14, putative / location=Cvel_scaffold465:77989-80395(+) / protein_length=612 / sequence_SO=supercontig / SO=protein_coding / is_pseudo=false
MAMREVSTASVASARGDEITAIESMFPDCFDWKPTEEGGVEYSLEVNVDLPEGISVSLTTDGRQLNLQHLPPIPIRLFFTLPKGYPHECAPSWRIDCAWLNEDLKKRLQTKMREMYEEERANDSPIVCMLIDFLAHECLTFLGLLGEDDRIFLEIESPSESGTEAGKHRAEALKDFDASTEAKEFLQKTHLCPCCFDEVPGKQMVRLLPGCIHAVCTDCAVPLCSLPIQEASLKSLRCPVPDCRKDIHPNVLSSVLSQQLMERWSEISVQLALDCMGDITYCPRCQEQSPPINTPVVVDLPSKQPEPSSSSSSSRPSVSTEDRTAAEEFFNALFDNEETTAKKNQPAHADQQIVRLPFCWCPLCLHQFCGECKKKWHGDTPCDGGMPQAAAAAAAAPARRAPEPQPVEAPAAAAGGQGGPRGRGVLRGKAATSFDADSFDFRFQLAKLVNKVGGDKLMKRCPRCKQGIEKIVGCHKMTCVCGAYFCWLCMKDIQTERYGHFTILSGPGGGFVETCQTISMCLDSPELRQKLIENMRLLVQSNEGELSSGSRETDETLQRLEGEVKAISTEKGIMQVHQRGEEEKKKFMRNAHFASLGLGLQWIEVPEGIDPN